MTSFHLIPQRLPALVQLEMFGEVFVLRVEFQCFGRPFDGGFEITRFGVSGGQGIEELFVLVAGLLVSAMFYAGIALQTRGLSVYIIFGIYGLVLIGVAVGEIAARYQLSRLIPLDADPALQPLAEVSS